MQLTSWRKLYQLSKYINCSWRKKNFNGCPNIALHTEKLLQFTTNYSVKTWVMIAKLMWYKTFETVSYVDSVLYDEKKIENKINTSILLKAGKHVDLQTDNFTVNLLFLLSRHYNFYFKRLTSSPPTLPFNFCPPWILNPACSISAWFSNPVQTSKPRMNRASCVTRLRINCVTQSSWICVNRKVISIFSDGRICTNFLQKARKHYKMSSPSTSTVKQRGKKNVAKEKKSEKSPEKKVNDYAKRLVKRKLNKLQVTILNRDQTVMCIINISKVLFVSFRVHQEEASLLSSSSGFDNYRGILNLCIVLLVSIY